MERHTNVIQNNPRQKKTAQWYVAILTGMSMATRKAELFLNLYKRLYTEYLAIDAQSMEYFKVSSRKSFLPMQREGRHFNCFRNNRNKKKRIFTLFHKLIDKMRCISSMKIQPCGIVGTLLFRLIPISIYFSKFVDLQWQ